MRALLLIILLLPLACGPLSRENVCTNDFGQRRACTSKELTMIAALQGLIGQIRNYDERSINENFAQVGDNTSNARVLIFGEEHTDIIAQIETLGAINALAQAGDTILLEGADRKTPIQANCGIYLILVLYINWQWEKLGRPYTVANVKNKTAWQIGEQFGATFMATKDSYNIDDLAISRLRCSYWDDAQAIKETFGHNEVTAESLRKRNESMVAAIKEVLSQGSGRAIVNTGFKHMPSKDHFITLSINKNRVSEIPRGLKQYYDYIRTVKSRPWGSGEIKLDSSAGTTEPIFKYLINNKIPFREFIHRRLERY